MSKPQINEERYVQLVNEKMKEDPAYKNDMRVELNPEDIDRPLGIHIIGEGDVRTVVKLAEEEVNNEYELVITPLN